VPRVLVRVVAPARDVRDGLRHIREQLEVPSEFTGPVVSAARAAARRRVRAGPPRTDARDLALVTIDPPRSRDLDQAVLVSRRAHGYRVHYAIADVAAFVAADDELDRAAHERGVTLYLPDGRAPLYPNVLGEGAASLLPGRERPALLWTMDLDGQGEVTEAGVARAVVRSRHALAYGDVQRELDRGHATESFTLLKEVGLLREQREQERGGVSFRVPTQEVMPAPGGYRLTYETPLRVEDWNAQISLLTGMAAARLMVEAGAGILRVLPPPDEWALGRLRRIAHALGIRWPETMSYPDVVRSIDPSTPEHAAFLTQAIRTLRGAGYALVGAQPGPPPVHAALAAVYAHVTAPLRRLADRYANEIVVARSAGGEPPGWAVDGLHALPEVMEAADRHAAAVERTVIDLVEAIVLRRFLGARIRGTVVDVHDEHANVQLADPPVIASVEGVDGALGADIEVEVRAAEPATRRIALTPV